MNNELITINNQECKIEYIGIYDLLDEILRRIKSIEPINVVNVDRYTDIFIKVYKELKDYKEEYGIYKKEIERLNNIINELEKYIGQEWYCFDNESVEHEVAKNILDKLKELKEGE